MGKMVKAFKSLFSGGDTSAQRRAIQEQQAAVTERERQVEATATGQRRARSSNRGLLAFVDDFLGQTFGGG